MERMAGSLFGIVILTISLAAVGQEPATSSENLLKEVIDFHVLSRSDSFTRRATDIKLTRLAKKSGMREIALQNHFTSTADWTWLAKRLTSMWCYDGIAFNRTVGGQMQKPLKTWSRLRTIVPSPSGSRRSLPKFTCDDLRKIALSCQSSRTANPYQNWKRSSSSQPNTSLLCKPVVRRSKSI